MCFILRGPFCRSFFVIQILMKYHKNLNDKKRTTNKTLIFHKPKCRARFCPNDVHTRCECA
jgi:hypothetical protein